MVETINEISRDNVTHKIYNKKGSSNGKNTKEGVLEARIKQPKTQKGNQNGKS